MLGGKESPIPPNAIGVTITTVTITTVMQETNQFNVSLTAVDNHYTLSATLNFKR